MRAAKSGEIENLMTSAAGQRPTVMDFHIKAGMAAALIVTGHTEALKLAFPEISLKNLAAKARGDGLSTRPGRSGSRLLSRGRRLNADFAFVSLTLGLLHGIFVLQKKCKSFGNRRF